MSPGVLRGEAYQKILDKDFWHNILRSGRGRKCRSIGSGTAGNPTGDDPLADVTRIGRVYIEEGAGFLVEVEEGFD